MKQILFWYIAVGIFGIMFGIEMDSGFIATAIIGSGIAIAACVNAINETQCSDTGIPVLTTAGMLALFIITTLLGAGIGSMVSDETAPQRPESRYNVRPHR